MMYIFNWRTNPQNRYRQKLYAVSANGGNGTKADMERETFTVSMRSGDGVSNFIDDVYKIIPDSKSSCRIFSSNRTAMKNGSLINQFNCNYYENTGF
jgi:hypothetical protein